MTKEDAIQELIDEIMDTFDVKKCVSTMNHLNWGWGVSDGTFNTEVPDEYEFRKQLRNSLKYAVKNGGHASGGFMITFHDSVDESTGEPFVMFRGGFYVESLMHLDGISYTK